MRERRGKKEEGSEGEREARREGERERAEERKSIPIQSESDKPEQCIVQTHSINQSHTHVHVEALTQTHMCLHTHTRQWVKCACSPP